MRYASPPGRRIAGDSLDKAVHRFEKVVDRRRSLLKLPSNQPVFTVCHEQSIAEGAAGRVLKVKCTAKGLPNPNKLFALKGIVHVDR